MKKIGIDEGKVMMDNAGVLGRALHSSPEVVIIHVTVQPGSFIKPHVTPVDVEFFVLEGNGTFLHGEESMEAGQGTLLPCPRGVPHGITNAGPGILRVLVVQNPRQ